MTDKKKPHTAGTGTASKTTFDSGNDTKTESSIEFIYGARPFCKMPPIVPTPGTQEARLLAELQAGRSIDPLSAWLHLGIYRLADCAFNLRRKGWPVLTERFAVINRFGEACHVARYSLAEGGGDA